MVRRISVLAAMAAAIAAPGFALAQSFSILIVEEMLGRVTIVSAADPDNRVSVPVGFKPHEIVVSPDGRTAYVSMFGLNDAENRAGVAGHMVSVIDIANAHVRSELRLPESLAAPHGLGFRPHHDSELFVNAEQGDQMVVFDVHTGRITRRFGLPAGIHNFIFSKDGAELFAFASPGAVYRVDPQSGLVQKARDTGASVRGLAWTADDRDLIAAVKGEIWILDPADLSTIRRFPLPHQQQSFYCTASPDGRMILVPSVFDGSVAILDADTGNLIKSLRTGTPLRVGMSPDRDLAYVANVGPAGQTLTVIHLHSLETADIAGVRDVNGLAFSSTLPLAFGAREPQPQPEREPP